MLQEIHGFDFFLVADTSAGDDKDLKDLLAWAE